MSTLLAWLGILLPVLSLTTVYGEDAVSQKEITPYLLESVIKGDVKLTGYYLDQGGSPNAADGRGVNLLMLGSRSQNLELLKLLLEKKANVNSTDKAGRTPLMYWARKCNPEPVKLLLSQGADVFAQANDGNSAISIASELGNNEVLKALLEAAEKSAASSGTSKSDALKRLRLNDGSSPYSKAIVNSRDEAVASLVSFCPSVAKDEENYEKSKPKPFENPDFLDVVFIIDSTGSMSDPIHWLNDNAQRLFELFGKHAPGVRIGIATYRDKGDEYLVKGLELTSDLTKVRDYLRNLQAMGGGDIPEAVEAGLDYAFKKMNWREANDPFAQYSKKLCILIGDAPSHREDIGRCVNYAISAKETGIELSTISIHSNDDYNGCVRLFNRLANLGGGKHITVYSGNGIGQAMLSFVTGKNMEEYLHSFD